MWFEVVLFSLVVLSGLILLFFKFVKPELAKRDPEPVSLDYARSFFPVLLIVFLLRGFVAEPFRIPSGSMLPTLEIGDFILVNKFAYGLRLPVIHNKVVSIGEPKPGDIMVFRVPTDNKTNYIKRVIGVPGDKIEYRNKRLFVNGKAVETDIDGSYKPFVPTGKKIEELSKFRQSLEVENQNVEFSVLLDSQQMPKVRNSWVVPDEHYFVMGDNRDHSFDSRFWGMVPEKNVVGKAFFVWFHWNTNAGGGINFSRIGADI